MHFSYCRASKTPFICKRSKSSSEFLAAHFAGAIVFCLYARVFPTNWRCQSILPMRPSLVQCSRVVSFWLLNDRYSTPLVLILTSFRVIEYFTIYFKHCFWIVIWEMSDQDAMDVSSEQSISEQEDKSVINSDSRVPTTKTKGAKQLDTKGKFNEFF